MLTIDPTYTFQYQDPDDGSWHYDSEYEYANEPEARYFAKRAYSAYYGGRCPIRIVKIARTVVGVILA